MIFRRGFSAQDGTLEEAFIEILIIFFIYDTKTKAS